MAIVSTDLFHIVHYEYGEAFFGSDDGMRFRVARNPLKNVHFTPPDQRGESVLEADVWPEPYSYAHTDPEKIIRKDFPFTQEGLDQAAEWINRMHEERFSQK